jgi:hypothetical protein
VTNHLTIEEIAKIKARAASLLPDERSRYLAGVRDGLDAATPPETSKDGVLAGGHEIKEFYDYLDAGGVPSEPSADAT